MEEIKQTADLNIFVIFDTKANSYRDPILAQSEWDIIRDYERMCRDAKGQTSDLVSNAEDFQIFHIGAFVKSTGSLLSWLPRHVANLHQIKSSVFRKNGPTDVTELNRIALGDPEGRARSQTN